MRFAEFEESRGCGGAFLPSEIFTMCVLLELSFLGGERIEVG